MFSNMFPGKINKRKGNCYMPKLINGFLSRVLFELLWRDYFKFVGLKYGTRIFHMNGMFGFVLLYQLHFVFKSKSGQILKCA